MDCNFVSENKVSWFFVFPGIVTRTDIFTALEGGDEQQ